MLQDGILPVCDFCLEASEDDVQLDYLFMSYDLHGIGRSASDSRVLTRVRIGFVEGIKAHRRIGPTWSAEIPSLYNTGLRNASKEKGEKATHANP